MFSQFPPVRALPLVDGHHHYVQSVVSDAIHVLLREEELQRPCSLPPIFAALEALDECPMLSSLLATFPPHIHYAIKASLLVADPYQRRRLQVLEMLIDKGRSMSTVVEQVGPVSPSCLFHHASVFRVIEGMCIEPSKYRRELAFLFAHVSIYRLPLHLRQKMAIASVTLPLKVVPMYCSWYLCSDAEGRLSQAIHDQAVLLVNDVILLKFRGKLSGVALQNSLLADGTQLIAGCWYAPVDSRDEIREAFDRGESRLWVEGQWTLLRGLYDSDNNALLLQAQTFATALPAQFPHQIAGFPSRQTYRYSRHEAL